ncbi:MAG: allantoinase AllB [Selenomonadaceae bacterium]
MYDLALKNGLVVNGTEICRKNVYVKDGKIAEITDADYDAESIQDAAGLYVLPGCIDSHCHFRDPGATQKEDFAHGTRSAAVGGVTTVFDMPNTNPAVLNEADLENKKKYFADKAYVDYALWGLSLGDVNLTELGQLEKAGAAAIKFFWGYAIDAKTHALVYNYDPSAKGVIPPLDDGEVYKIFEEIAKNKQILAIHAENSELIHTLTERVAASGRDDYPALMEARPALAEILTVQTALAYSRATGARLHILHVTARETVELIRRAKKEGIPVTAETCPHYLFLSADDYDRIGPMIKVYPVIKEEKDRVALWEGLLDGTLDFVASDHAPHKIEEKKGSLFDIPSGMCGVESMLPLLLGEVSKGKITLPFVVKVLAEHPAEVYGLMTKGFLTKDMDADIVLVDMRETKTIRNEDLHSKQPMTAFDGMEVTGWPVATYLRGQLIAKKHDVCGEKILGKWLSCKK